MASFTTNLSRIHFSNIKIGDKFRKDFFNRGKTRNDVVCIKTGKTAFMEEWNKREHTYPSDDFFVTSFR